MKEVYYVTLHQSNDKGFKHLETLEFESMTDVGRALITFRPKRGYQMVFVTIAKQGVLL